MKSDPLIVGFLTLVMGCGSVVVSPDVEGNGADAALDSGRADSANLGSDTSVGALDGWAQDGFVAADGGTPDVFEAVDGFMMSADTSVTDAGVTDAYNFGCAPLPAERSCMGRCAACPTTGGIATTGCTGGSCVILSCAPGYTLGSECLTASSPSVAPLYDPMRESLPRECGGTTLTVPEIVALFEHGAARYPFLTVSGNPDNRGTLARTKLVRTCHPVTGCSPWTTTSTSERFDGVFQVDAEGHMFFLEALLGSSFRLEGEEITSGDTLLRDPFLFNASGVSRARFTREGDGSFCFSTVASEQTELPASSYYVTRYVVSDPAAGSSFVQSAPFSAGTACAGPTVSNAALISAWFPPGNASVLFNSVATATREPFWRRCHPQTGCSSWRAPTFLLGLRSFEVSGAGELIVRLQEGSSSSSTFAPVTAGTFSGSYRTSVGHDLRFAGRGTTSCVEQTFRRGPVLDPTRGPGVELDFSGRMRFQR